MTDGAAPPSGARSSVVAVALVAAVTLLVLLVSVWAASTGPDDPFPGDGLDPERVSTSTPTETPTEEPTGDDAGTEGEPGEPSSVLTAVIGLLVLTLGVLLVVALVWAAGGYLLTVRLGRRERGSSEDANVPPLDPVEAIVTAMVDDAEEQRDLLTTGTPRNALVECWHRFEVQAERAGVPREPWETSAEFTLRLLDLVEADAGAVSRLSELYREARFSEHELGEDAREVGLETLAQIHRDLRGLLSRGRL